MVGTLFGWGSAVVKRWPLGLRYRLAALVGVANYSLRPSLRHQALENYAAILDLPPTHPDVRRVTRAAFVGYTKLLADFLVLPAMTPTQVLSRVAVEGFDNVAAALQPGKGAVVVTPHYGNWDFAAAAAAARGLKVTAVTEHFGTGSLNERVVESRARHNIKVVPVGVAAGKASLAALRRNELVALVCDLPGPGRNLAVRLCGQPAMVPAGPALLALRTGAMVLPITCQRLADDSYRLVIEAPMAPPAGGVESNLESFAQAIVDRFEPTLRANPEQWYLFSPMWQRIDAPAEQRATAALAK